MSRAIEQYKHFLFLKFLRGNKAPLVYSLGFTYESNGEKTARWCNQFKHEKHVHSFFYKKPLYKKPVHKFFQT